MNPPIALGILPQDKKVQSCLLLAFVGAGHKYNFININGFFVVRLQKWTWSKPN